MNNFKRILAIIGIVILVALYTVTLILAFSKDPNVQQWFTACIIGTIAVPILIYVFIWLFKKVRKDSLDSANRNYIVDDNDKDA